VLAGLLPYLLLHKPVKPAALRALLAARLRAQSTPRAKRTNEVAGRGSYPGPIRQQWLNKAVYGNAVWQRSTPQVLAVRRNKVDTTTTSESLKDQGKSIKRAVLTGSLLRNC